MDFNLKDDRREAFLPLTYTRPVGALRIGLYTIAEKWEVELKGNSGFITEEYLANLFPRSNSDLRINARWLPCARSIEVINELPSDSRVEFEGHWLASRGNGSSLRALPGDFEPTLLSEVTDIFSENGKQIEQDIRRAGLSSVSAHPGTTLYGSECYIDPTAKVRGAILNSDTGPIYIGPNAEVMEGSVIRGPFALMDHATVKLSTKVYGATTIGPWSKIGGEVSNSVIQGYSNKGHDGFLGNSILGEWCNLGADTNNSNLKNNYGDVKLWNYERKSFASTGLTFCGLIMGDHSKSAINTQFNTGTVVGVGANVFDSGFPPKFIPSFSWGGASGFEEYEFEKAIVVAERVYARRSKEFGQTQHDMLKYIFDATTHFRSST